MDIYPTKDELLSCIMACPAERVVVEVPLVTVVVEDFYPVLCSKLFKGDFGGHCFFWQGIKLELNKA